MTQNEYEIALKNLASELATGGERLILSRFENDITIELGSMYEPPKFVADIKAPLCRFFRVEPSAISFDSVSKRGCDTCDWGSLYGKEFTIKNPQHNKPIQSWDIELK